MMEINVNMLYWLWVASVWMITICVAIATAKLHTRIDELEEKLKKEKLK